MKSYRKNFLFCCAVLSFTMTVANLSAETLYVDSRNGNDTNPGTKEEPLTTLRRAARLVNSRNMPGPTTIKIAPGIYNQTETLVFENSRPYTDKDRLTIEATTSPDRLKWDPALMPVILSTQDPKDPEKPDQHTETYSLKIKLSHVTIRGLKFLGNPLPNNWHACVERVGKDLDDLLITQCMFVGDRDALNIYCPAIATGNRFVVDHCIFYHCHASAVYWDGLEGIPGTGCAMRYCIVDGAQISGAWTCQTAEDFEFHHNIITRCEYFWMRKPGDRQKYRVHNSFVTGNKYYSGHGGPAGPFTQTGPEVAFDEKGITKQGQVILEKNKRSKYYLHVVPGTLGGDLGAGLFVNHKEKKAL
jgi:hypothetical protein